jgi:hypothetical protein
MRRSAQCLEINAQWVADWLQTNNRPKPIDANMGGL